MDNEMEVGLRFRNIIPIMKHEMERRMEHAMGPSFIGKGIES